MTWRAARWAAWLAVATILASACSANGPAGAAPTLRLASALVQPPLGSGASAPSVAPSGPGSAAASSGAGSPQVRPSALASGGSASALASASPSVDEGPFPNVNEKTLLDHLKATVRPSCQRTDRFFADEVDSVSCGGDPVPFVDYTLFPSVDELRAAYQDDVGSSESAPVAGGACAAANYEDSYSVSGDIGGRLQCTTRTSTSGQHYKVIEWMRENLNILSYMSSQTATWDQMIAFWKNEAGPYP